VMLVRLVKREALVDLPIVGLNSGYAHGTNLLFRQCVCVVSASVETCLTTREIPSAVFSERLTCMTTQQWTSTVGRHCSSTIGLYNKSKTIWLVIDILKTRSHPEMVGNVSRVTLNFDLSKIPFVHV